MKRAITVILSAVMLLLCGCQPTPKEEYVANKGDNIAEERINASALPTATPSAVGGQTPTPTEIDYSSPWEDWSGQAVFPERWEDNIKNEAKEIIISADIITSGQESYPVQLVRRTKFKVDDIMKVANYMFHDVTGWKKGAYPTREYIIEAMQHVAASDMKEQNKQDQLEWLNVVLSSLSESESEVTPCSSLDEVSVGWGGVVCVFTESGGGSMSWKDDLICIDTNLYGAVNPRDLYMESEPEMPEFIPEISLEEARAKGAEFINAMGIEGFELYTAVEARCVNGYRAEVYDMGWELRYTRSYGYFPFSASARDASRSGFFWFDSRLEGAVTEYSAPIKEESIILYVTGNGIKSVTMKNPYEYVATVNENVQLMNFDELTKRIKRMVVAGCNGPVQTSGYYVLEEMILTVMPQPKRNSSDYYLMPVWVCRFGEYYSMDGPNGAHYYSPGEQAPCGLESFTLAFNAIDGTTVSLQREDITIEPTTDD